MNSTVDFKPTSGRQYIPSFDGIRCLAVIFVLLLHGTYGLFPGGWIGVDLFFVLSGYLITSLLQSEYQTSGRIVFAKFYARRSLRLFPPLITCLLLGNFLWDYVAHLPNTDVNPAASPKIATLAGFFYFANLVSGEYSGPLSHLWSLSVEEHFYLFWPIVALFLFESRMRTRLIFIVPLICAIALFRIRVYHLAPDFPREGFFIIDPYRFSFCRMDSILMGALMSIIFARVNITRIKTAIVSSKVTLAVLLCILGVLLLCLSETDPVFQSGGFILTNLLCLALVAFAALNPDNTFLSNTCFSWVGRRSYGIYVYHFPIFLAFEGIRQPNNIANFVIITLLRFLVSGIVAELSYRYIEQPVLRWKKRFESVSVPVT